MYRRIRMALFLLVLSACSSAPANIRGELLADAPFKNLYDNDKINLVVWACPKDVQLSEIYREVRLSGLSREAVDIIAGHNLQEKVKSSDNCLKAKITEDNRNYSFDGIPLGRYEIVAFADIVDNLQTAVTDHQWWLIPVNIRENETVDLLYREAH